MKLIEHIELVKERLGSLDRTNTFHNEVIKRNLSLAYEQIMYQIFRKDVSNLDDFTKRYKGIVIQKDSDTDMYYALLPAIVMQLPDAAKGVRKISWMKGTSLDFVPTKANDWEYIDEIDDPLYDEEVILYCVRIDRVEFKGLTDADINKTVKMDLLLPLTEYDDLDEIKTPAGADTQMRDLCVNYMQGTPIPNLRNDNASPQNIVKTK